MKKSSPPDFLKEEKQANSILKNGTDDNLSRKGPFIQISPEFDFLQKNKFSKININRSNWVNEVNKKHPKVKEAKEKVLPLNRAIEFGRLYVPDDRLMDHSTLLCLISQHLRTLGLIESQNALQNEWIEALKYPSELEKSQLHLLIQKGVINSERFWELTMPDTKPEDGDKALSDEVLKVIGNTSYNRQTLEDNCIEDISAVNMKQITPKQLMWICTTPSELFSDELLHSFCIFYSVFSSAAEFFARIKERFFLALNEPYETREKSLEMTTNLLLVWLEECSNEIGDQILSSIKKFAEREIKQQEECNDRILKALSDLRNEEEIKDYSRCPKVELNFPVQDLYLYDFDILCLPAKEFARQMNIYFTKYFYKANVSEFLDNERWENPKLQFLAPNIVKINKGMSNIIKWCEKRIMENTNSGVERIDIVNYFYKVARELFDMHDYQNCGTILQIFEQPHIHRLKSLMSQVSRTNASWATSKEDAILNSEENMKNPIELALASLGTGKPCFPYINAYLNRLGKFIASNKGKKGFIDTAVITQVYQMVNEIKKYRTNKYCFIPIDQAQEFFENIPEIEESELDYLYEQIKDE